MTLPAVQISGCVAMIMDECSRKPKVTLVLLLLILPLDVQNFGLGRARTTIAVGNSACTNSAVHAMPSSGRTENPQEFKAVSKAKQVHQIALHLRELASISGLPGDKAKLSNAANDLERRAIRTGKADHPRSEAIQPQTATSSSRDAPRETCPQFGWTKLAVCRCPPAPIKSPWPAGW